ncbi:MAG: lactate racemase domain-containing protein [Propionibacteriaceae bacterium]|jgi:nickel-dependent lactate racemase|nr:lactate racemase domain-containing protein [Propionibacteriaceae bacterium]
MTTAVSASSPSATTAPELIGGAHRHVADDDLTSFIERHLAASPVDGSDVVLVIPDATRSMPLPLVMRVVHRSLIDRVASLTAVIALGTHAYMEQSAIEAMFGVEPGGLAEAYPGLTVVNHEWADPSMIVSVGRLSANQIDQLSQGRMREEVEVEINRRVAEAGHVIVIGPVFPHEVVGISGGNKYFVPGVATHEIIDLTHWVGALIGIDGTIGRRGTTAVRAIIDAAAALIPAPRSALCLVVESGSGAVEAAAFGTPEEAWALASEVAADSHIVYLDAPVNRMLAIMPRRYDDIWTAAKGCYKAQPVMAEGGEVVIYAPHITELSQTHPEIEKIGYHCMEFFLKQWDVYGDAPKSVLAHSTHVRGAGTYDPATGVERDRIRVTLATGIPREVCERANVGYLDPATIDVDAWRADPEIMVVDNAGEVLFRLAGE